MSLHTGSEVNACTVSNYRRVIQGPWSQLEQVDSSTTSRTNYHPRAAETHKGHNAGEKPILATKGFDKTQETSSESLGDSLSLEKEEPIERTLLDISDSSCTETACTRGGRKGDRSRKKVQSQTCNRTGNQCRRVSKWDSGDSEECGGEDDTYDTDTSSNSQPYTGKPHQGTHKQKMKVWKTLARGKFEEMLLECIVNTDNIPPKYENIFVDPKVIGRIERVTTLGLSRPKAFSHGVLENNKVTGAILYGPPGTGKTLLARGVAKQAGFNMLSISTSEVWQKCHGDDEKMIKAVFSMARKMYPSIVFLDEADAMLGERKAGEKRHLRAMLNKFLSEWDGMTSGIDSPFILLATNRPNDLDSAVLRRAPVRIHLHLPTKADRKGILGLLLKNETLGSDINVKTLANLTPQYTGSDLKSLCVTAATECIAEQPEDTAERTLTRHHFIAAMQTIKATVIGKTREQDLQNFQNNRQEQAEEE